MLSLRLVEQLSGPINNNIEHQGSCSLVVEQGKCLPGGPSKASAYLVNESLQYSSEIHDGSGRLQDEMSKWSTKYNVVPQTMGIFFQ